MEFEVMSVKKDGDIFYVGETVIHKDGSYAVEIVKFCLSQTNPIKIWFYDNIELKFVKDLNNFRKVKSSDVGMYNAT